MDQKLLLLINRQWTTPGLDRCMALMSSLDAWLPILLVAALAVAIRAGFRGRAFLVMVAVVVLINDAVVANSLKHAVHRLRPIETQFDVRHLDLAKACPRFLAIFKPLKVTWSFPEGDSGQGRSFPSGHVIDTISVALLTTLFYARYGWLAFIVPLLVGYSRVYVGSHWPTDVLASIFIGLGATLLLATAAELLWRKFGGKILPRQHHRHPTLFAS